MYYFPGAAHGQAASNRERAHAFVYEVRDDPRDTTRQIIEIVVDCGRDFVLADLRVDVEGDRLVIGGDTTKSRRRSSSRSSVGEFRD